MMNIDTQPHLINLPKIIPELKDFNFDLDLNDLNLKTPIQTSTVNPISRLDHARKQWHERDLKRELKIKKLYKEADNDNSLLDYEKQIIKRLVTKTDGHYKLETVKK